MHRLYLLDSHAGFNFHHRGYGFPNAQPGKSESYGQKTGGQTMILGD